MLARGLTTVIDWNLQLIFIYRSYAAKSNGRSQSTVSISALGSWPDQLDAQSQRRQRPCRPPSSIQVHSDSSTNWNVNICGRSELRILHGTLAVLSPSVKEESKRKAYR
jgi:hypothetical protein